MRPTIVEFLMRLRLASMLSLPLLTLPALSVPALAEGPLPFLKEPVRFDVGASVGFVSFSDQTGLGNVDDPVFSLAVPGEGPLLGLHAGAVFDRKLGIEAAYRHGFAKLRTGALAQQPAVRVQAVWHFQPEAKLRPFALLGYSLEGFINRSSITKPCDVVDNGNGPEYVLDETCLPMKSPEWDQGFYVGGGATYMLNYRLGVRADLRFLAAETHRDASGATQGLGGNFEAHIGAVYSFGGLPEDTDKDGIPNTTDRCPAEAEDKDGFEDTDGCPDPDNDQDGIPDASDKCVNDGEDLDKFEDADGCPDPDNDKDGILDVKDKCPLQPETKNGFQDDDGCPDVADTDGDGIIDSKDRCPTQAEDKDGFEDTDGCPESDNDKDGIPDLKDKCPLQPETANGIQDDDGCPDEVPPAVQALFSGPQTFFEFKADKLQPGADSKLDPLVEVMLDVARMRIEVVVQPTETGDAGKQLAEVRGKAIKALFEEKMIEAERVTVVVGEAAADAKAKADPKALVKPSVSIRLVPVK
jgi:outer membrane protein OmpA-like peptidoglycan-associated protein